MLVWPGNLHIDRSLVVSQAEVESQVVLISFTSARFHLAGMNLVANGDPDLGTDGRTVDLVTIALQACLLYTSPSPRDGLLARMPSSA